MIAHVLRKDWILLWPLAVLVTAIQVGYEWTNYKLGFFTAHPVAGQLLQLMTGAWLVAIVVLSAAVVQEDTIPGVDQDWLIRPVPRTQLLMAKLLFLLLTICVPMLLVNVADALALGFPAGASIGLALYKESYVVLCLILPVMALASATRNLVELLVLMAAMVVVYAACLWVGGAFFGADRCPTCDTAISWIQHLLQHLGVLAGAIVILCLQYYRRRTQLSRGVAFAGVVVVVCLQIPWNVAFGIQSWVTGSHGGAASVSIDVDTGAAPRNTGGVVTVPLKISGVAEDEFLMADRARFTIKTDAGKILYRGTNSYRGSAPLTADRGEADSGVGTVLASMELPRSIYSHLPAAQVQLGIDYSLTVMGRTAEFKLRAVDGEVRSPALGVCQSRSSTNVVLLRCKQIGQAPVCYRATLIVPEGRHNPEVLECSADYRPYIPPPANMIAFSGLQLPTADSAGLAHYPVDPSSVNEAYIRLEVYQPRAHFQRQIQHRLTLPSPTPTPHRDGKAAS